MKRLGWMMVVLGSAGTLLAAPNAPAIPQPPENPAEYPAARPGKPRRNLPKMSTEEQQAMQQRRFEIMVLLHTYQLLPEKDRAAVKAELEKRIAADLTADLAQRKAKLAAFEAGVAKMKQEIAAQEGNMDQAVAAELERLLKMPLPLPPAPGQEPPSRGKSGRPEHNGQHRPPVPPIPGVLDAPEEPEENARL